MKLLQAFARQPRPVTQRLHSRRETVAQWNKIAEDAVVGSGAFQAEGFGDADRGRPSS